MADHAITQLLGAVERGDAAAKSELLRKIFAELRALAAAQMSRERSDHTLQATALVNEAYVRVLGGEQVSFANRRHLFGAFAEAMRQILIDSARRSNAQKRGGGLVRFPAEAIESVEQSVETDTTVIAELLPELQAEDERAHEVVMLRFFAGLKEDDIAHLLGVTTKTVQRDWSFARAWLNARVRDRNR